MAMIWRSSVLLILLTTTLQRCHSWHGFTNDDFHCWPLSASSAKPTPFASCQGVTIRWVENPPRPVKAGVRFNVTYTLNVDSTFYVWAVSEDLTSNPPKENFFKYRNGSVIASTALEGRHWCENTQCPVANAANQDNCCVHHINVHSCPLDGRSGVTNGLCGPWIKDDGETYSHSQVLVGPITDGNWTSEVDGLIAVDNVKTKTSIIAHFKIAGFQIVVNWETEALPRAVCGNNFCESADGETCERCPADCGRCPLQAWEIGLIVAACALMIGAVAGIIGYFSYRNHKLFWDESWIIPIDKIKQDTLARGFMGSTISIQTNGSRPGSLTSNNIRGKQRFTETGFLDGRTVAIKRICKKQFTLTKDIRKEVKQIRQLDHPNLCKFIGGCVEVANVAIISEYCPKGSLNDILLNEDVPINWGFRFSFATDIARGVGHLHHNKIVHGKLKSQNCVVDDRWTVKVTDFGLHTYRINDIVDDDEQYYKERLNTVYHSPERKKNPEAFPHFEADVFAFGVILYEIATRDEPLCDERSTEDKWLPKVPDLEMEKWDNRCPCPAEYCSLMKSCWSLVPEHRPRFEHIKRSLHHINPQKMNPVDLMMNMMEKYSKHLEVLVGERTQDLTLEKQKTDRLLYSMLPRAIADDLRLGRAVQAKAYNSCTIYFSDIVGFTTLSGDSTPFEVVALLNKLYTCFDTIIDKYDVYKVETIGDAYMVVSGLPIENGMQHAREIACMSIDIVRECETFIIPHKPNDKLKIRVGLHSGFVCAGVVGLKMPRYCLFGDTVNTASRMESNGEAYKIHISDNTYQALQQLGGFVFKCRGTIPVKGKGDMTTYWLLGKDDECIPENLSRQTTQLDEIETDSMKCKTSPSSDSGYDEKYIDKAVKPLSVEVTGVIREEHPSIDGNNTLPTVSIDNYAGSKSA